jgi:hypothetical protein
MELRLDLACQIERRRCRSSREGKKRIFKPAVGVPVAEPGYQACVVNLKLCSQMYVFI